jgi:UDP-2,4-diacetamido-2,4,6-trideoxy-beta-L-altropyranose hydrolase
MSSAERSVTFRTTCSARVGLGHLRRCLTLAQELRGRGWRCAFLMTGDGQGGEWIRREGFEEVTTIEPGHAGAVVIDDYAVSAEKISGWRRGGAFLCVLDDLADRPLDCDLVVNACAGAEALAYRVAPGTRLLLGPRYALLRPEFAGLAPRPAGPVRRTLVMLGGSDPLGHTIPVVEQLRDRLPGIPVDVVVGPLARPAGLQEAADLRVLRDPGDVAALMRGADLAVTSGGQTTYELAACGLPAVALCEAENQRRSLAALAAIPTLVVAGDPSQVGEAAAELAADPAARGGMGAAGQALVDGRGVARVASAIEAGGAARWP